MSRRRLASVAVVALLSLVWIAGCPSSRTANNDGKDGDQKRTSNGDSSGSDAKKYKLGDLIEKFDPPTLEELNEKVTWKQGPVLDSMELLRERQHEEGPPELTVKEALQLKNTSPQANTQILSTMGRLPENPDEVNWDAYIIRHIAGDVKSTNPLMISSTAEFDVTGLTGIGLFGFDWTFRPYAVKDTVVSWEISEDGLYDKVVIRDDITWSDGTPFTAQDVEFSYKVIMTDAVPVPAVRSGTIELKYVKAYNDHTVVFFHKEALATNVWNVNFPLIPKHIFEKSLPDDPTFEKSDYHIEQDRNPVVAGAYKIDRRVRGQEIVLSRREDFYMHEGKQVRDKPHFKEVRFKVITDSTTALLALKKGDIEEMQLTPEQWQTQTDESDFYSKNTKAYDVEWVYFYFGWNCQTPYFSDKRVRQAMSYAFDHKEMLEKHRFGLDAPCTGIFHPTSRWAPHPMPEPYKQDLDKAEELLEAAGWTDSDGDGILDKEIGGRLVPFEFTILTSNRPDRIALCNLLRENLDRIGIICNVRPLEFTVLQDRSRTHKFHAMMAGWGTGTDPDTAENLWKSEGAGRNYGQYANKEVDRLFEEGKRELDPKKRAAIYQKIHMLLWEDQPYTWLYFQNAYFGFNKDLRGYNFSPRGPYNYGPGFSAMWKPAAQ